MVNTYITFVTVCFNAKDSIRKTIDSVLKQNYEFFEYIIVDGMSSDGTYEVVQEYSDDSHVTIIHEEDKGIYDAMNKAVNIAKGEYIFFLGAGDVLKSEDVSGLINKYAERKTSLLCFNMEYLYSDGTVKIVDYYNKPNLSGFRRACGFPTCHQSFLVRTEIMLEHKFNLKYKYGADQDILAYCLKGKNRKNYTSAKEVICVTDPYGVSADIPKSISRLEFDSINKEHNRVWFMILWLPKLIVRKREQVRT